MTPQVSDTQIQRLAEHIARWFDGPLKVVTFDGESFGRIISMSTWAGNDVYLAYRDGWITKNDTAGTPPWSQYSWDRIPAPEGPQGAVTAVVHALDAYFAEIGPLTHRFGFGNDPTTERLNELRGIHSVELGE
ncbi:hypothetical protein [Plantibacter sp. M259]|uniref:hypothetical protein n=1 Tax=Plantibacter sp. M259 TaxID=2583822 RepID=UPI001110C106|nr:hypothetical protein [Plantibacter sp. M259]